MEELIPTEIITHILSYLNVSDWKAASVVSKKWYEASLDRLLLRKFVFVFTDTIGLDEVMSILSTRTAVNVRFENLSSAIGMRAQFVARLDRDDMFEGVQCLSFKNCEIMEAAFTAVLSHCRSLKTLDIAGCVSLFVTGMLFSKAHDVDRLSAIGGNLQELTLASIPHISDKTLNRFLGVFPAVRRLGLAGNRIVFHSESYYRTSKNGGGGGDRQPNAAATNELLTFANIMSFLNVNSRQIVVLDFSRTSMNNEALGALSAVDGLRLTELYVSCCQEIGDDGIVSLCQNQPSLSVLDISECLSVTDRGLTAIGAGLVRLKTLVLVKCRQLTETSICKLRGLQQLSRLDLNSCYMVTSRGLQLGVCSLRNLTFLKLSCCTSVSDGFVIEASEQLSQLTHLDLSSCRISNASVLAISCHLTKLERLLLAWCQDLTDDALLGIKDARHDDHKHHHDEPELCRCTRKHSLSPFAKPAKPSDNRELADFRPEKLYPISNLRRLKLLDLTSCHRLTDDSVADVVAFPDLKRLFLGLIPNITDRSLDGLASGAPSVEELYLSQCNKITDDGMIGAMRKLKRLSLLNISGCDRLTNRTVEALFVHATGLRHLDVSLCSNITAEVVEMLENNMQHLHTLHRRHLGTKSH